MRKQKLFIEVKKLEKSTSEEAFLKQHSKEDLATDVIVEVPDLPMFSKTKK